MPRKINPLINRSALMPGESLPSLIVRLSAKNYYSKPAWIPQLCQKYLSQRDNITHPTLAETYELLEELTLLDIESLYQASVHRFTGTIVHRTGDRKATTLALPSESYFLVLSDVVLQEHFWPEINVQFCPYCLRVRRYHRLSWMLQAVSTCLEHHCLLVQGCPDCGAKLKVQDVVNGHCQRCEFDLLTSSTSNIADDEFGLLSQRLIQSWFGVFTETIDENILPDQPFPILYQIACALQRAVRLVHKQWDYIYDPFNTQSAVTIYPCQNKSQLTPLKSYLIFATAIKGLLDWPNGFYEFLNAYRLRDQREPTDTVHEDLGYLYSIRSHYSWKHPAFQFLREALGRYLQENYQHSFALKQLYRLKPNGKSPIPLEYISNAQAARILDITPSLVKRLVQTEYLASYNQVKDKSTTRRYNLVRHQDVLNLQQSWQGVVPLADASRLLGVSETTTLELVENGLISETLPGQRVDNQQGLGVSGQALANFVERLRRSPVYYQYSQPVETINLTEAVQKGSVAGGDMISIIRRILAGEIRAYWPEDSNDLEHLVVSVEDLKKLNSIYV